MESKVTMYTNNLNFIKLEKGGREKSRMEMDSDNFDNNFIF